MKILCLYGIAYVFTVAVVIDVVVVSTEPCFVMRLDKMSRRNAQQTYIHTHDITYK